MQKLRRLTILPLLGLLPFFVNAQGSFVDVQKSVPKLSEVYIRVEDTLQKQFEAKKLVWPARYVYLR